MKTKNEYAKRIGSSSANTTAAEEVAEFHARRVKRELKIERKKTSSIQPTGNYEYEQMIAEESDFHTGKLISEAAYFLAEGRGFVPGNELADWLRAEREIEKLLRPQPLRTADKIS